MPAAALSTSLASLTEPRIWTLCDFFLKACPTAGVGVGLLLGEHWTSVNSLKDQLLKSNLWASLSELSSFSRSVFNAYTLNECEYSSYISRSVPSEKHFLRQKVSGSFSKWFSLLPAFLKLTLQSHPLHLPTGRPKAVSLTQSLFFSPCAETKPALLSEMNNPS